MGAITDTESVNGIFKKDGLYGFRANVPGGGGKQVRRGGFPSQDAAYQARNLFLAGRELKVRGLTFNCAEWFAEFQQANAGVWRPTTASNYRYNLDQLLAPLVGDIPLVDLDETEIRKALNQLTHLTSSTIETALWRLRACMRAALREQKIQRCPADNVRPPKGKPSRQRKVWSFTELMQFAAAVREERDGAMWGVWMTTGLRRGEICGLQWDRVNAGAGELTIDWQRTLTSEGAIVEGPVKTDEGERLVPLDARVLAGLHTWKSDQAQIRLAKGERWQGRDFVFTTRAGKPYYPGSFGQRLDQLTKRAGLPRLTPHELRHTYGTRAVESGMEIKVLSRMMGHAKVETTLRLYVHPSTDQLKAAQTALSDRMFG